jgi:predicted MPP superfamily phosphohydrolase
MESRKLETIAARINALEPEIVLLPGDIVDESVSIAEEERMISALRSIRAPLGVFSVPGNHEYYGGFARNMEYLARGGVRVLQDEAVTVGGAFVLAGRKDPTALRFGEKRKILPEILDGAGVDRALPVILLDHQPVRLKEAEDAGVDLQLSGHTHAGQLFPLNLINKGIYEQYWGYLRKGKTHYYVSCGIGTWGPPVRTGSVPEIVRIRVTFEPPAVRLPSP